MTLYKKVDRKFKRLGIPVLDYKDLISIFEGIKSDTIDP